MARDRHRHAGAALATKTRKQQRELVRSEPRPTLPVDPRWTLNEWIEHDGNMLSDGTTRSLCVHLSCSEGFLRFMRLEDIFQAGWAGKIAAREVLGHARRFGHDTP